MRPPPLKTAAIVMLLGSLLPLGVALVSQFAFKMPPCHFCLLQRVPYIIVALCGCALLLRPQIKLPLVPIAILSWLTTAALGLYHTGIERGWVEYSGGCVADKAATSVEDLRMVIMNAPKVACDEAQASLLGLSMASWNSITALGWILLLLVILYRGRKVPA